MAFLLPIAGAAARGVAAGGARVAAGAAARGAGSAMVRSAASATARGTAHGMGVAINNVQSHSGSVAGSQQFTHTAPAGGTRNDGITFGSSPRQTGMSSLFSEGHPEDRGVSTLDPDGLGDFKTGVEHPGPPRFHTPMAHMKATSTTVAKNTESMEKNSIAPIGKGSNQSRWLFGAQEGAAAPSFSSAAFGRPGG